MWSPLFYFTHIFVFLVLSKRNVNQIAVNKSSLLYLFDKSNVKHCLIETNGFLIGEFMFILNIDWMGRNN